MNKRIFINAFLGLLGMWSILIPWAIATVFMLDHMPEIVVVIWAVLSALPIIYLSMFASEKAVNLYTKGDKK